MPKKNKSSCETIPDYSSPEQIINSLNELKEKELWLEWVGVMTGAVKEKKIISDDPRIKRDLLFGMEFLKKRNDWSLWLNMLYYGIKIKILDPNDNLLRNDFRNSIKIMEERRPGLMKGAVDRYISKGLRLNIIDKSTLNSIGYADIKDDETERFVEEIEYPELNK
ncbi:MAG: hypothetical protein US76_03855 [Parcubacteria group bacterium GW2011_GWA2_38_13b]|nr:MAG: hypothetical protein US76_03855 [Parcubacteria group bacterium GW2011_GWA2_38_13b]